MLTYSRKKHAREFFVSGKAGSAAMRIRNNQRVCHGSRRQSDHRSVDVAGKPTSAACLAGWYAYTGRLICFSVFGAVKTDGSPFTQADCPGGVDSAAMPIQPAMFPGSGIRSGRRNSTTPDTSPKFWPQMPMPNNFFSGERRWPQYGRLPVDSGRKRFGDPTFYNETLIGNDPYSNRKQFNIKIDHNLQSTASTVAGTCRGTIMSFCPVTGPTESRAFPTAGRRS